MEIRNVFVSLNILKSGSSCKGVYRGESSRGILSYDDEWIFFLVFANENLQKTSWCVCIKNFSHSIFFGYPNYTTILNKTIVAFLENPKCKKKFPDCSNCPVKLEICVWTTRWKTLNKLITVPISVLIFLFRFVFRL